MSEVLWSIDAIIIKENVVYGYGWVWNAEYDIFSIRLKLFFSKIHKSFPEYIAADVGRFRKDVNSKYKDNHRAINSGFFVYGEFSHGKKIESVYLECTLSNGSVLEILVPQSNIIYLSGSGCTKSIFLKFRQLFILSKRCIRLLFTGNFGSLYEKASRYLRGWTKIYLKNPGDMASFLKGKEGENICLIVDHDLGGGANHYRERLVDSIVRQGRTVVIVTCHVGISDYVLVVKNKRVNLCIRVHGLNSILEAVSKLCLSEVIYNDAVSFLEPEVIPFLVIGLKFNKSAQLKVLIHDFFIVCPSHFLINYRGEYCKVPDVYFCEKCLKKNKHGLSMPFINRDITKWRKVWGGMLLLAEEIVTFSNSSMEILMKAYPQIDKDKIKIKPHDVSYIEKRFPIIKNVDKLCIGIVGQIGSHKGALFVQSLSKEIKLRGLDAKIVVIGTIEAVCDSKILFQTGPYRHEEMVTLIENSGANVFLFPSIWPETFSYVVEELITMKLPVAAFNLGAPAERLAIYQNGLVLEDMNPSSVLDALISFHRKIYSKRLIGS